MYYTITVINATSNKEIYTKTTGFGYNGFCDMDFIVCAETRNGFKVIVNQIEFGTDKILKTRTFEPKH